MGIIHSNKYSGISSTTAMYMNSHRGQNQGTGYVLGIVTPIWDLGNYNPTHSLGYALQAWNHLHTNTTPTWVLTEVDTADQVAIGSTVEYRRSKAYHSPTGSPYMYDSGDIFTAPKPLKTHYSWLHSDTGHGTSFTFAYQHNFYTDGNITTSSTEIRDGVIFAGSNNTEVHFDQWGQFSCPHWMAGFSIAQSGEYILTGIPHMCGSGSTTTTEPDGFGSVRSVRLWNPYIHLDPDRYEEMVKKIGFQGNNLDDKRVNPYGGVFLVEWTQPFSVKRSEADHRYHNYSSSGQYYGLTSDDLMAPGDSCESNLFGPYFPSAEYQPCTVLNDVPGWSFGTGFSTSPSYPSSISVVLNGGNGIDEPLKCETVEPPTNRTDASYPINVLGADQGPSDYAWVHYKSQKWGPVGTGYAHTMATFVGFNTDPSGNQNAKFGYSIDMSDGFFISGAPGYYGGVNSERADRGAVGVFIRDPNSYDRGIFNVNPRQTTCKYIPYSRREGEQPGDRFGHAVACGFGRYIVGAPGFNEGQGKAYLYADVRREHEAGLSHEIIPENDPTLHHGHWIYSRPATVSRANQVGIPTGGSFCKHGHQLWGLKLIKELTPATGIGQSYGYSVSIGNGRIAVGNLAGAGSVEIFNLEGNRIGILTAPDGQTGDCFGRSVDIRQGIIAVGAPHATVGIGTTNVRCGAVYAFDRNRVSSIHQKWMNRCRDSEGNPINPVFLWKQYPLDGADGDRFGDSLDVGSGRVVVGAPYKSHFETPSADGSAYCFNLHGNLLANITANYFKERNSGIPGPGIRTDSHFGHAVSVNGHNIVISAPFHAEWIEGSASYQFYTPGVPAVSDQLHYYYTPQCITVWDLIDNNHGAI